MKIIKKDYKKSSERYQRPSEDEKEKSNNMVVKEQKSLRRWKAKAGWA